MSKITYFTEAGLKKLKDDLGYMVTKGRADIARQIAEAREKGDLSENAEYDAAKDAQGMLEMKISKLEETISTARVVDESRLDTSKVVILSTVRIKNTSSGKQMQYMLVSEEEANLKTGKISVSSPIGKGLLGRKKGDKVKINVPSGTLELVIMDISV